MHVLASNECLVSCAVGSLTACAPVAAVGYGHGRARPLQENPS